MYRNRSSSDRNLLSTLRKIGNQLEQKQQRTYRPQVDRYDMIMQQMRQQQTQLQELLKIQTQRQSMYYTPPPISKSRSMPKFLTPMQSQYEQARTDPDFIARLIGDPDKSEMSFRPSSRSRSFAYRQIGHRRVLTGFQRFRVAVIAVLWPIFIRSRIRKRLALFAEKDSRDMVDALYVFTDQAKNWILATVRMPLLYLVRKEELDVDLTKFSSTRRALSQKQLKQASEEMEWVRSFINTIIQKITSTTMPQPLISFLNRLVKENTAVAPNFFTPYEIVRLNITEVGRLKDMNLRRQQMILAFFLISMILVENILLKMQKFSSSQVAPKCETNAKVIASILQHIVLLAFVQVGRSEEEAIKEENDIIDRGRTHKVYDAINDNLSDKLFSVQDLAFFYFNSKEWSKEASSVILDWLAQIITS